MNRLSLCSIALLCAAPQAALFAQTPCSSFEPDYRTQAILEALVNPPHDDLDPSRKLVLVVAHRGDWQHVPENSLEAIREAAAAGIELIEVDVRLSRDGGAYLLHDYKLDRSTTGTGYVDESSSAHLSALNLRDRYGRVTPIPLPTFADLLEFYYNDLTCMGSAGYMRGPALIVDVKGGHGATTYHNLKPVVDISRQIYGASPGAGLVFKVKAKDLPPSSATLEQHLVWSGTVRDPGQNLILVLNPDDPTIMQDPIEDSKFMEYQQKPYVLGFELNQSYKGDELEPYVKYLKSEAVAPPQLGGKSPRTVMMYLQDNFLPEGVAKSDATCCYLANSDIKAVTPASPLDYRGRIELFGGRADLLTVDRLSDVLDYLRTTGRRDLTLISN